MEPQKAQSHELKESREVSIIDLLIVLLKYKWLILSSLIIASAITLFFLKAPMEDTVGTVPEYFYSDCVIQPYAESDKIIFALLHRAEPSMQMLSNNAELYSTLYPDLWDTANRKWKTSTYPFYLDTWKLLRRNLLLSSSDNMFTIGFLSEDSKLPPKIINYYVSGLSEYLRKRDESLLKSKIVMLKEQIRSGNDLLIKVQLSNELIKVKYDELRLRNPYYGFNIIVPTGKSIKLTSAQTNHIKREINKNLDESMKARTSEPKRTPSIIIALVFLATLAVAVSLAFIIDAVKKMRENNPDKFVLLQRYLSFRTKNQKEGWKK